MPFDHVVVAGLDLDGYRLGLGHSVDTDLPPMFLDAYYGEELYLVDPFLTASLKATGVTIEADVYRETPPPPRLRYITEQFEVFNRTLFPLFRDERPFGAVALSRATRFDAEELAFLSDIAPTMHEVVTRPITARFSAQALKLTAGEVACLKWASHGKTSDGVAAETGYAAETVNSYIKSACRKLGAENRVHAIAEALRRKLIR
ncbi:helix-turn-helix transcriptional regulator [Agrobacterium sp. ES01]|uniref:helix-turn-helix transcriptional regulator n=1 Tax=Agrobacterium sp. ES01 TaxID=3420714 RepID=UPI003D1432E0